VTTHVYEVDAYNYAHDSENRIHDDAEAARYGFRGGLVPGAAVFAYLARAVHAAFGDGWLEQGSMQAKFVKPVYHGERARAQACATGDPERLQLALVDWRGVTCAVGEARRVGAAAAPRIEAYPAAALPAPQARPAPTVTDFAAGHVLGSRDFRFDEQAAAEEAVSLFVEPLLGADGRPRWHPGLAPHLGNHLLRENVRLGAWVHTASTVRWFGAPHDGEHLTLRGRVADTYQKRGHVVTDCDLALFGHEARPLLAMRHSAIIRLAADAAGVRSQGVGVAAGDPAGG